MMFKEQADQCRKQASEFAGRPEAPFLLRVASVFDELDVDSGTARLLAQHSVGQSARHNLSA